MVRHLKSRSVSVAVLLALTPVALDAQSSRPASSERDAAVLTVTASSAAEDNGQQEGIDVRDPQYQGVRLASLLTAAVSYNEMKENSTGWQFAASTGMRHYASLHELLPSGQSASGSLAVLLGRRFNLSVSGSAAYSPNYSLVFGAIAPVDADPMPSTTADYSVVKRGVYSSATNSALSVKLDNRTTLRLSGGLQRSDFVNPEDPSLNAWDGLVRLTRQLTRSAGLHVGYGRKSGRYGLNAGVDRVVIDDIDVGLDYNRPLSSSRRTFLSFGSGSAMSSGRTGQRDYSITGNANLSHGFGRTGHVTLAYDRSLRMLEGFSTPVFTDNVLMSLVGNVAPRVALTTSAGYSVGLARTAETDTMATDNGLRAWTATGRVNILLNKRSTLYAEYQRYQYNIGQSVHLLARIPNDQDRQTLRVGLSIGVPLVRERIRERK